MKAKKKIYISIVLIVFIVILLISYILYIPPLLDEWGYNIPGRIYDFFAYAYYSSRMDWLENAGNDQASRRMAARAVWHRPGRMEELLGIPNDDLFQLGRNYAGLGLDQEAVRLFRAAFPSSLNDGERSLEIISNLAILGDWPGAAYAARELLKITPESSEVNYWMGRSLLEMEEFGEASVFLGKAVCSDSAFADAFYQAGRVDEEMGRISDALSRYEKAVRILPRHRESWAALARIYKGENEIEKRKKAVSCLSELTPEIRSRAIFGDRYILRGYNFSQTELMTGEKLTITLFIEDLDSGSGDYIPVVTLTSSAYSGGISRKGELIPLLSRGEVVGQEFSWDIPQVIYPGLIDLEISFADKDTGRKLETGGGEYLRLPSFNLSPGWIPTSSREELVRKHFGEGARSLGMGTFLGPGTELIYDFEGEETVSGLGLVSYGHSSGSLPQGSNLGQINVNSNGSDDVVLPINIGLHTSEVWWEYLPVRWKKGHSQAPIFHSRPVRAGGSDFNEHEYFAVYRFPRPLNMKDIKIKNISRNSGLYVRDIILLSDFQKDK